MSTSDECNRPDTTLEGLAGAASRTSIKTSGQGTVTAGNSSQLSDGASATLLMSRERAEELGIKPKLIFRGFAVAGCEPDEMGIGPVFAVPKLLKRHGLKVEDIDLWELNEAFAVAGRLLPRPARHRSGEAERQRRLDLDRPSVRHDRLAHGRHASPTRCCAARRATAS